MFAFEKYSSITLRRATLTYEPSSGLTFQKQADLCSEQWKNTIFTHQYCLTPASIVEGMYQILFGWYLPIELEKNETEDELDEPGQKLGSAGH